MPPHTPRSAVIEAATAARDAGADLIATIGGGSLTDGAKAVRLCLANDIRSAETLSAYRPVKEADGSFGPPPCNPPSVPQLTVPTTLSAGEFSAISGITAQRRLRNLHARSQLEEISDREAQSVLEPTRSSRVQRQVHGGAAVETKRSGLKIPDDELSSEIKNSAKP